MPELIDMPGAVVHARTFSSDDPTALGWSYLRNVMSDEGLVTLRGADPATVETAKKELGAFEPNLHYWDLFMADARAIRDVCGSIVEAALPEGLLPVPDDELTPRRSATCRPF